MASISLGDAREQIRKACKGKWLRDPGSDDLPEPGNVSRREVAEAMTGVRLWWRSGGEGEDSGFYRLGIGDPGGVVGLVPSPA